MSGTLGILLGVWFLLYGLVGLGVRIPSADAILAILALIIGVLFLLPALRR